MIEGHKTFLVTGASGFLGRKLVERLLSEDETCSIVAVSRNEGKLIELKNDFQSIDIKTGDISNPCFMRKLFMGYNFTGIYHLAAFKHVGIAESQPMECINSNIVGTQILLELAAFNPIEFIVGISTDKAAQVNGVYGASKLLMEALFREEARINPSIRYRIVRYGNVLYSTGSILTKWKKIIQGGGDIVITDEDSTRFYWTVDQAIDHIFDCLNKHQDVEPFCPVMKAMRLGDLLKAMIEKYGEGRTLNVKKIGLQRGENMHETLDGKVFSDQVDQFTVEEIITLI